MPVWTSTVPPLLLKVTPSPNSNEPESVDLVKLPWLLNAAAAPVSFSIWPWVWARKVPRLLKTAPSSIWTPSLPAPDHVAVWPAGLIRVQPSSTRFELGGLMRVPPLAVTVPEPDMPPPLRVSRPPTVMAPGSLSVPPPIVKVDEVVNADAIESVPPLIVKGWLDVRLLIVSVMLSEWTTSADALMVTSSPMPGRLSVLQFPGVSQLLSWALPVQTTLDSRVRSSIHSRRGRHDLDRDRPSTGRNRQRYGRIAIASQVERPVGRDSELDEGLSAGDDRSTRPLSRARRVRPTISSSTTSAGNATPAARIS